MNYVYFVFLLYCVGCVSDANAPLSVWDVVRLSAPSIRCYTSNVLDSVLLTNPLSLAL